MSVVACSPVTVLLSRARDAVADLSVGDGDDDDTQAITEALNELERMARRTPEFENAVASVEEWKARALAAEAVSERKEQLLRAVTDAAEATGRTAVGVLIQVNGTSTAICLHGPAAFENDLSERWGKAIGGYVALLDCTQREIAGLNAVKRRATIEETLEDG